MVNWTTNIGAIFYMAIAEDGSGRSHSCTSTSTSCLIEGLMCAQHYNATIVGSNIKCNSTVSKAVAFMTGGSEGRNRAEDVGTGDAHWLTFQWHASYKNYFCYSF